MDSFFSLFDPSDGHQSQKNRKRQKQEQDTVKKKQDAPKGRRRGRKAHGKNESLPEESSFLCEPELSTELLLKDASYIESYIEVNTDSKTDQKPKRRNSTRKNRRRKNKISPAKDSPLPGWESELNNQPTHDNLNNNTSITTSKDDNIGKNVNDLTDFKFKRKDFDNKFSENEVYNVIEKLEKVKLKDDVYLNGDFSAEDLDNDCYSSSDEMEDYDDSASEADDSGDEVYGRLPPEPRFGNVEYKLQLVAPCERRFQHLVTQLKWRLRSGGGSAVYVVGVRDCGALRGLRAKALRASLHSLRRMARALMATLAHISVRRVGPQRAVAEVYIRKLADPQQSVELRVAVMGANEAGKSTIIGVLTQGELDNGRGSARLNMFRHLHEVKSGRTSSLSHEILGFDAQGNVVNYGCSELMTAERIGERSAKLVSFLDLAGHSKYQRTTVHGLTGYSPHYAMLVMSATAGITRITEEHVGLLLALDLPFFAVVSKCELAPGNVLPLLGRLQALLAHAGKKPLLITDENMARDCVAPQKLILDTIDDGRGEKTEEGPQLEQVPVFPVSCVRGVGLNALHAYLLALQPPAVDVQPKPEDETCEFQIDEIFHVGESEGPVVGGLLAKGQIYEGDQLIIGPMDDGAFVPITVRSVYRNRAPCGRVLAGRCASLGLRPAPARLRAGQVLVARRAARVPRRRPQFGCNGTCSAALSVQELMKQSQTDTDNRKSVRRKNKNLLQDVDNGAEWECSCEDRVYLEDPDEPRGCLFFQASVQVLRHSTSIGPGFQCTVHVGNVRQTAIVEGIMSRDSVVRAGEAASALFRFVRCPEYLVRGRRLLFTAGLGTRGIGRVTQVFPYIP